MTCGPAKGASHPSGRALLLFALTALAILEPAASASHPVAPVRFRITEVASAFCEWSGETTFTCRHVRTPFAIEVRFEKQPGRTVVMKLDGRELERSMRPFTTNFAPGVVPPGAHRLTFSIRERGEESWSRSFAIRVSPPRTESELPPPVVSFRSPSDGARLVGKQIIEVQAYNPKNPHREVDRVTIQLDGTPLHVEHSGSYRASYEARPGPHTILATAVGSRGQVASTEVKIVGLLRRPLINSKRVALSADTKGFPFQVPNGALALHLSTLFRTSFSSPGEILVSLKEGSKDRKLIAMRTATGRLIPLERDFERPTPGPWELLLSASGGGLLEMRDLALSVDLP